MQALTRELSSDAKLAASDPVSCYRPLLQLGRGGMARVYLAERSSRGLSKLVVLKVLEPELAQWPDMRSAFRREAELCARLNHPNIVQVYEVHDETTVPVMVMEYVEGVTLAEVIERSQGRLPLRLHLDVIGHVLAALHYFHEVRDAQGVPLNPVHRDVSPQNVLVMHEGGVKVLDFGIAKLRNTPAEEETETGVVKGKLGYMPTEQLANEAKIDRRADVFAVGVMLWEAFARRPMWKDVPMEDVTTAILSGELPPIRGVCPSISAAWEAVIQRAVAQDPEARFESALQMQVEMEACMAELGGPVQQRELATFMAETFGDFRREQQRSIAEAANQPRTALSSILSEVGPLRQEASGSAKALERSLDVARLPAWWRGRLLWWGGAAALVAFLAASAFGRRQAVNAAAPSPPLPASAGSALSVTVPQPDQPLEGPAPARPEQSPPVASVVRDDRVPLAPSARRAAQGRRPPAATKPRVNCDPPYVLDAEGIRTYKVECF